MNDLNTGLSKAKNIAVTAAAALGIILLAALVYGRLMDAPWEHGPSYLSQSRQSYFQETERKGILSAADYDRLTQASNAIQQRQEMSQADLDFWVAVLQKGPLKDTPVNRMAFDSLVLGLGIGPKQLTPTQQEKMYDAVLPFVSDAAYAGAMDPSDKTDPADMTSPQSLRTGEEEIAAMLLAETRDPRALGVLKRMAQNSPYPHLRRTALKEYGKLAAALAQPTESKQ